MLILGGYSGRVQGSSDDGSHFSVSHHGEQEPGKGKCGLSPQDSTGPCLCISLDIPRPTSCSGPAGIGLSDVAFAYHTHYPACMNWVEGLSCPWLLTFGCLGVCSVSFSFSFLSTSLSSPQPRSGCRPVPSQALRGPLPRSPACVEWCLFTECQAWCAL